MGLEPMWTSWLLFTISMDAKACPAFNGRIKFIREELDQRCLSTRADGLELIERCCAHRDKERPVHGTVVQWPEDGGAPSTILKSTPTGYGRFRHCDRC